MRVTDALDLLRAGPSARAARVGDDEDGMITRARHIATLASLVLLAASCGPSAGPGSPSTDPGATSPVGSPTGPSATASPATASAPPSASPKPLRIGLVSANPSGEASARDAAVALAVGNAAEELGVAHETIQTEEDADYGPNIQSFVDHGFRIVVTVGETAGPTTIAAARAAPGTSFIGVDQLACVTPAGEPDPTSVCEGDAATLVPNYQALAFADEQAGYLAGKIAASVIEGDRVGVVGGTSVPWVVRMWRGFENGAHSIDPDLEVRYVELAPDAGGFGDPALARAAADQLVTDGAELLFQLAGDSGPGVIEGACAAGIRAIGSIVDQARALPDQGCLVTSAEKRYAEVVVAAIADAAVGELIPGTVIHGLGQDPPGVGVSPLTGVELSADTVAILEAATRGLAAGTLDPCAPIACTITGN